MFGFEQDLLAEQFHVTLGHKMMEHLQKWIDAERHLLGAGAKMSWEPGSECEIAVKMLDVFHKLPCKTSEFLETHDGRPGLVVITIGLEDALPVLPGPAHPNKCWSPYREPLVRYLEKYANDSIDYFVKSESRLATPDYFLRFLDILQHPSGKALLQGAKSSEKLLCSILEMDGGKEGAASETYLNSLHYPIM